MNKFFLLPRLSILGIRKNGSTYVPYILAGILAVFAFFSFSTIIDNDIMRTLPRSSYALILMQISQFLLGLILLPFITYTNSFLIKRRKKELGLYSVLGLDKKHIAVMMLWETLLIYVIVIAGGVVFGLAFSKLIFLALINLSLLSVETGFTFSLKALNLTLIYFLVVYGFNLIKNVIHVFRNDPNELIRGPKKGDREPRFLWLTALSGLLLLGIGYVIAIKSKIDTSIFVNFLLAVALVVIGTHQFFKAGLLALLKILKHNRKIYYSKTNFVTISGMLHRMKKSASSLSNICIFSTMTIITLLCTLSVLLGSTRMLYYRYPYDAEVKLTTESIKDAGSVGAKLKELADEANVKIKDEISFTYKVVHAEKQGSKFIIPGPTSKYADRFAIRLVSLEDYNRIENRLETLENNEIIMFSTAADYGFNTAELGDETYSVKKELETSLFQPKEENDIFMHTYYMVVKDTVEIEKLCKTFDNTAANEHITTYRFNLTGTDQDKNAFVQKARTWCGTLSSDNSVENGVGGRHEMASMNGGLIFMGIFFSIMFTMCLILIMYYKQIAEGYDDRENFDIMQKVGMSDAEVRGTIRKQILMVFYSPLLMAILHTMAGFSMTAGLLGAINLFDRGLIIKCALIVSALFIILYGFSYSITSRTYYGIVKKMNEDTVM
jgi:putative ABC transport system permease protein